MNECLREILCGMCIRMAEKWIYKKKKNKLICYLIQYDFLFDCDPSDLY